MIEKKVYSQREALEKIRDILLAKYGTQSKAAKKLKHTEAYISNVLNGNYKGIPARFLKMAKIKERPNTYEDI